MKNRLQNTMQPTYDTIAAIATPPGAGAIGVLRLSGSNAISITDTFFRAKKKLADQPSHTLHFGRCTDPEGHVVDEVVVSLYRGPKSYTGEDVVEISCHGSDYILQQLLQLCLRQGARLADPGEYTMRAFLNGKMDLSQAEAVADLIASDSAASHELAMKQMRGGYTSEMKALRDELIHFAALIELELDFAEEDVAFADRQQFLTLLDTIESSLQRLIDSFAYGNVIKNGVPVAIAGKPNAGKSSLLNALLNEERAIVSDIAGTTRDVIEDTINIHGITFRFIDTAGLRETEDTIEAIGVERAKAKIREATILLYLFDKRDTSPEEIISDVTGFYRPDLIILLVATKTDLFPAEDWKEWERQLSPVLPGKARLLLTVSSKEKQRSFELLKETLADTVQAMKPQEGVIVSNLRHSQALHHTLEHIRNVKEGMNQGLSGDLLAQDIRLSMFYLGSITGEIEVDRDILGTIFGKFCIGK